MGIDLISFKELIEGEENFLENLLFGNGFSRGFHDFSYDTLYKVAEDKLTPKQKHLFEAFTNTSNFEEILHALKTAIRINDLYNITDDDLQKEYLHIKNALIRSVRDIHPQFDCLGTEKILMLVKVFLLFKDNIFTTNYDLLSYWAQVKVAQFKDYKCITDLFGKQPKEYLHFKKEKVTLNATKLYFLHGGLHLFMDKNGDVRKVVRNDKSELLLDAIETSINEGNLPLYVAEGNSEDKYKAIQNNTYLEYCYNSLSNLDGYLTIFGQDLGKSDNHLINGINQSKVEKVAFGIYDISKSGDIKERIKQAIPNKEIVFFNSNDFLTTVYNRNIVELNNDKIIRDIEEKKTISFQ
ncbi:DUF4917 family protein [Priestia megaterium]|uniref:DUF4917 family protein n=1 Tax=Priestia megaterium TaxID=1404 RepID=UPI001785C4FE|nr:DUF4917 family protein [Priestia megaterium]MBD8847071.1 DUF4917 family protein [Priestia megaterium]